MMGDLVVIGADHLSLRTALFDALFKPKDNMPKTLLHQFAYPRLGAGRLCDNLAARIQTAGSLIVTGTEVLRIRREGNACLRRLRYEVEGSHYRHAHPRHIGSGRRFSHLRLYCLDFIVYALSVFRGVHCLFPGGHVDNKFSSRSWNDR